MPSIVAPRSGLVYVMPGPFSTGIVSGTVAYAHPFVSTTGPFVADQVGVCVSSAGSAGAVGKIGIYRDRGGLPGRRLFGSGDLPMTSVGGVAASLNSPLRIDGERLWLVTLFSGAPTTKPTMVNYKSAVAECFAAGECGLADFSSLPSGLAQQASGLYATPGYVDYPEDAGGWNWANYAAAVPMVGLRVK